MDKHKLALDVPYKIFMKEGSFPNDVRRASLERVCISILRLCHVSALTEFFTDHIKDIVAAIVAKQVKVSVHIVFLPYRKSELERRLSRNCF